LLIEDGQKLFNLCTHTVSMAKLKPNVPFSEMQLLGTLHTICGCIWDQEVAHFILVQFTSWKNVDARVHLNSDYLVIKGIGKVNKGGK
jgi:hypothetical protein